MAKLKAAFTLLPDRELTNRLSAAALLLYGASSGRLRWPRLPPHLSLNEPFLIESFAEVEAYFDALAGRTAPVSVTLRAVESLASSPNSPEAVVRVGIDESAALRELHTRLNSELHRGLTEGAPAVDGEAYRFHMTLGFLPSPLLVMPPSLRDFSGEKTTFHELALFLYEGLPKQGWQCMRYKMLPLAAPDPALADVRGNGQRA